jgi:hypothetical protein
VELLDTVAINIGGARMLGFSRWQLFKGLVLAVGTMGVVSLVLTYSIPAPPSTVIMATGFKGTTFEHYGRQYREIFARFNTELELREATGAVENLELLLDPKSGVQIALMVGGVSDGKHAPGLLSLGTVYNNPFGSFIPLTSHSIGSRSLKANVSLWAQWAAAPDRPPKRFWAKLV